MRREHDPVGRIPESGERQGLLGHLALTALLPVLHEGRIWDLITQEALGTIPVP